MKALIRKQITTLQTTIEEGARQEMAVLVAKVAHKDCPTDLGICGRVAWHRNEIDRLRIVLTVNNIEIPKAH